MKTILENLIKDFVKDYLNTHHTMTSWSEPLTAYASADDPDFLKLEEIISPSHALMKNGKTVVTYFIPFDESISKSNISGKNTSKEWALAYIETNTLITDLKLEPTVKKKTENCLYKAKGICKNV